MIGDVSLHAYTEAHPAVKASQPQFWGCKDKTYFQKMQIVGEYFSKNVEENVTFSEIIADFGCKIRIIGEKSLPLRRKIFEL